MAFEWGGAGAGFPRPELAPEILKANRREIETLLKEAEAIQKRLGELGFQAQQVPAQLWNQFAIPFFGISGLMGFPLWLYLLAKGLEAFGNIAKDSEQE